MKKVALILLTFILLAASAFPVFAKNNGNNGQGNGNGNGNNPGVTAKTGNGNGHGQGKDKNNHSNQTTSHGNNKMQQNAKWMIKPFYLQGTITAIDAGAHTITVNVVHANAKAKSYIGSDLTVVMTDTTQIFQINQGEEITGTNESGPALGIGDQNESENEGENNGEGNRVPITFDQLAVGDRVAIHGMLVDTTYTARLVTVYIGHPFNEGSGESNTEPTTPPITQPISDNP